MILNKIKKSFHAQDQEIATSVFTPSSSSLAIFFQQRITAFALVE